MQRTTIEYETILSVQSSNLHCPFVTSHCMEQLEKIQSLTLKFIYPCCESYDQRCKTADIEKLCDQLQMICVIYCQKKRAMHKHLLPELCRPRRRTRQSSNNSRTIPHNTALASRCLFIKYGNVVWNWCLILIGWWYFLNFIKLFLQKDSSLKSYVKNELKWSEENN